MSEYHKIQTVFHRNPQKKSRVLPGHWTLPEFQYLSDKLWICTEKIDGTNIRLEWDGKHVTIKGRQETSQVPHHVMEIFYDDLEDLVSWLDPFFTKKFGNKTVTVFGEAYGPKIQKVGKLYNPNRHNFAIFDIMIDGIWLSRDEVEHISAYLGFYPVPFVKTMSLLEAIEVVRHGFYSTFSDRPDCDPFFAEGLVCTPAIPLLDAQGNRIITKIKTRDFKDVHQRV